MRKFGIELEVSGISKEQAAEALQAAGIETVAENYNHRTRTYWKATTDSSIRSDNGLACEVVSPPLPYRESSFLIIARVVAVLQSIGAQVNDSCGMHVHVDCRNITDPDFYRLLLTFYSKFEGEIDSFVHSTRRDNSNNYCRTNKSLYDNWDRLWSSYVDMAPNCLTDVFSTVERYHKLNFASYVRHGTVEFRQYQGTLDAKEIRAWIDFCVGLVDITHNLVSRENKQIFRPANSVAQRNAPQVKDYINAFAKNLARTVANEAIEYNDSYAALTEWNRLYRSAVRRPIQFSSLNLDFTNEEINTIFKFVFFLSDHIATRTREQNENNRLNGNDLSLRDSGFIKDDDFINHVVSMFFGYHGTKSEVTRKVNSKLTNLGILRNGQIIYDNDFFQCLEWMLDRNAVNSSNLSRNKYWKLIFNHQGVGEFKTDRLSEIQRLCSSFIIRTRRFFVNNPRNLRDVIGGTFVRNTSVASEVVTLVTTTSCRIKMWNDENEISYTSLLLPRRTVNEQNHFRSLIRSNSSFSNVVNEYVSFDTIYSLLNSNTNYEPVGKQPYFDFVDNIRKNDYISSTFFGLTDTSKVLAVRGDHGTAAEITIADSVRRAREFIDSRNAPPRRAPAPPAPRNGRISQNANTPRVVTDIPLETESLIQAVSQLRIPPEQIVELTSMLRGASGPIEVSNIRNVVAAIRAGSEMRNAIALEQERI